MATAETRSDTKPATRAGLDAPNDGEIRYTVKSASKETTQRSYKLTDSELADIGKLVQDLSDHFAELSVSISCGASRDLDGIIVKQYATVTATYTTIVDEDEAPVYGGALSVENAKATFREIRKELEDRLQLRLWADDAQKV